MGRWYFRRRHHLKSRRGLRWGEMQEIVSRCLGNVHRLWRWRFIKQARRLLAAININKKKKNNPRCRLINDICQRKEGISSGNRRKQQLNEKKNNKKITKDKNFAREGENKKVRNKLKASRRKTI